MFHLLQLLLTLPVASLALKAEFSKKENATYPDLFPSDVPTLEEFFYSFYEEDFEFDGEKVNINDALITMRSMVQIMEKNILVAKGHLHKMELMEELVSLIIEYEGSLKEEKLAQKIYISKMSDLLFLVATFDSANLMEKLELFYILADSHPIFDKVVQAAIDVACEYKYMAKYLPTVSVRVESAYLLALRVTMVVDDRTAIKRLYARMDEVLAIFTDKDHEDMDMLIQKMLENKEALKFAVSVDILEELRELLKY